MQYLRPLRDCQPNWRQWVDDYLASFKRILWPPTCVLCKAASGRGMDLCSACERDLALNDGCCRTCAHPLPETASADPVCGACRKRLPKFDYAFVPHRYGYPLDHLVQRLKYGGELAVGRVLGELFARHLLDRRERPLPHAIVPVPLGRRRYVSRKFNQAVEIGRPIARACGVRMYTDLVVRTRDTREQASLERKQRRRNVRGAFAVVRELPCDHVAILDDVVTTASTVNEIARVLRRAGARTIEVWAIARAGK